MTELVPADEVEVVTDRRPPVTDEPAEPVVLLRGRATGPGAYKLAAGALLEAIKADQARLRQAERDAAFQAAIADAAHRVDLALGRVVARPPAEC